MRKIHKLILIVSCCLGLQACESFLNVNPPSDYTDKTFYLTQKDFTTAITASYGQLMKIYGQGSTGYINTLIYRGDESRQSNNVSRFMDGATETAWKSSWEVLWSLIYRCNKILDRIDNPEITFTDEKNREHIKGEALAMRGYAYLQLAWCWGGGPIITTELSLAETLKVPRSSQEANYAQAESDFLDAFDLLPETWDSSNTGRVTKYAAAGMLGRLYLYIHDYESAEKYLSEVVAKEGSLYQLETNYDDCFDDAKNNSKERVWEVQYLGGSAGQAAGLSQQFSSWFIPSSLNIRYDGPKMHNVVFTGPSGSVRASESIFADGIYEANDKRRNMTLVNGLYLDKTTPSYDIYFCKKFLKATGTKPTAIDMWGNNLPILRYTDVKLMYAEALNENDYNGNINSKILPIINDIRNRAGLTALVQTDLPTKEAVLEYLIKERFIELCFEGLRWPDLIRWGKAQEAMDRHFAIEDEGFDTANGTPTYSMKSYNLLAPIPNSEIVGYNNRNVMWQNPGY